MGNNIKKQTLIDQKTGEILREKTFLYFDGFNDKGYKYRYKHNSIKYYSDCLPCNLSEEAYLLLMMLAELVNEDNVLVYRVTRKSKFSSVVYKPMEREDIRNSLRYKYGQNKFDRCWAELKKHCIKRIKYHDYMVWCLNPSIINRCPQLPPWLYDEFKTDLNPYLTTLTIQKFENLLKSYE